MKNLFILLSIFFIAALQVKADSPITSTIFYQSYQEQEPLIEEAAINHELTSEMISFLDDEKVSDDKKLALINALGWGNEENLPLYEKHLKEKYSLEDAFFDSLSQPYLNEEALKEDRFAAQLTEDERLSWAYLKVMDDYFAPLDGLKAAMYNIYEDDKNFSHLFLGGLILTQIYTDQMKYCNVYLIMAEIRGDWSQCHSRLSKKAMIDAWNYIGIYEESCTENGQDVSELKSNLKLDYKASDFESFSEDKKSKRPDLEVEEVLMPDYIEDFKGTYVEVKIENRGKVKCILSAMKFMTEQSHLLKEDIEYDEDRDYQYNYEQIVKVPEIPAKSTVTVKVYIEDYWIYDPNCEIKIILDPFDKIEEKKEKNNVFEFFEFG